MPLSEAEAAAAARAAAEAEAAEESGKSACLSQLMWLSLAKCPGLTSRTVGLVSLRCPRLRCLDISNNEGSAVTDESLRFLAGAARLLESINVSRSKAITDDGLRVRRATPASAHPVSSRD